MSYQELSINEVEDILSRVFTDSKLTVENLEKQCNQFEYEGHNILELLRRARAKFIKSKNVKEWPVDIDTKESFAEEFSKDMMQLACIIFMWGTNVNKIKKNLSVAGETKWNRLVNRYGIQENSSQKRSREYIHLGEFAAALPLQTFKVANAVGFSSMPRQLNLGRGDNPANWGWCRALYEQQILWILPREKHHDLVYNVDHDRNKSVKITMAELICTIEHLAYSFKVLVSKGKAPDFNQTAKVLKTQWDSVPPNGINEVTRVKWSLDAGLISVEAWETSDKEEEVTAVESVEDWKGVLSSTHRLSYRVMPRRPSNVGVNLKEGLRSIWKSLDSKARNPSVDDSLKVRAYNDDWDLRS